MLVHPRVTMVAMATLATFVLDPSLAQAKSPPSAYGSSFDDGESISGGSPKAAEDVDDEETAPRKPSEEAPTFQRVRPGQRVKPKLDGAVGDSELDELDDE